MISIMSGQQAYISNVKVLLTLQVRSLSAHGQGSYSVPVRACDHLEDPCVDRRIILKWIFSKWDRGMDWIDLAQNREKWRVLVNAVKNLRVP
jgi:hypothetical protein